MAEGGLSLAQLEQEFQSFLTLTPQTSSSQPPTTSVSEVFNQIAKKNRQRKKKQIEGTNSQSVEHSSDAEPNVTAKKTRPRKKKQPLEGTVNQATGLSEKSHDEKNLMENTPLPTVHKKVQQKKPPPKSKSIDISSNKTTPLEKQSPIENQQNQRPKSAPQNLPKISKSNQIQSNGKISQNLEGAPIFIGAILGPKLPPKIVKMDPVKPAKAKGSVDYHNNTSADPNQEAARPAKPPKPIRKVEKPFKPKVQKPVSEQKSQSSTTVQSNNDVVYCVMAPAPSDVSKLPLGEKASSTVRKSSPTLSNAGGNEASGSAVSNGNDNKSAESQNSDPVDPDMVRISIYPPPLKKKKKNRKQKTLDSQESKKEPEEVPNQEPERQSNQDDSGSSSSSSSDEGEKLQGRQPLVFNIRKKELELFRRSGVFVLKHISPKFPRAIFHCHLCSFHVSSIPEVHRHMKDERHVRLQAQDARKQTASLIPNPPEDIVEMVGQFIQDIYLCSRLTNDGLENRRQAITILKAMIELAFPGYSVRAYGSFVTELGLQASNVNVGLVETSPEVKKDGLIIVRVLVWLQTTASTTFRCISNDLNCRTPIIHFSHDLLNVSFSLVAESENAYKTTILLQQYRLIDPRFAVLTVAFRTFARICHLDKPELGSLPAHAFTLMVLHYMQQDKVLPALHELKASEDENEYLSAAEFFQLVEEGKWKPRETSLGQLWLGLLKYYAYSFNANENAVCVRSTQPLSRTARKWGNRRLAIEDPFHANMNVNLGTTMSSNQTYEFYLDCVRNMFHYFWIPQTAEGPLYTELVLPGEEVSDEEPLKCTPAEALERVKKLSKESIKWDFEPEKILCSRRLPVVCTACGDDGHTRMNCRELEVDDVGVIPPPDFNYLALLDKVCWNIFRNFAQRDEDIAKRNGIKKELEHVIKALYPDAILTMFGSSCNGFGFADSDVDLCMTFESNPNGEGLDFSAIVKKLGKVLRACRSFSNVMPITSAKVPIVKLRHRATGLESDVSLYNQLGRRNSQLLATYCAIDARVRILGYMAKLLAKQCDIGDASRGSLSSYAYTLMVIHYLQQVKPPVIPVLQEITDEGIDRSQFVVEGWDTWYFDNVKELARVWPHYQANRESPSTLWLGFLLYYAKVFDFRLQVVTIRQLKPLYRLEKGWTDRPIAIEDPFLLTHNLGSGISPRMGCYIRRVFVASRRFFQTPVRALPPNFTSLEEYLFNPKVLTPNGPPPRERGCDLCGKIGHKVRDCPNRRPKKRQQPPKNDQQPQQQQRQNQHNLPNVEQRPNPRNRNLYRPEGPQVNRDYRPMPIGPRPQPNRYRPAAVQPTANRAGQHPGGGGGRERVYQSRREIPDPNQPSTALLQGHGLPK